jgi:hypothetical protein
MKEIKKVSKKSSGIIWSRLLKEHPEFAKYCDWQKLDNTDWIYLLRFQPHLAKYRKKGGKQ